MLQLTLFDAICPTCLTPWSIPNEFSFQQRPWPLRVIPCSLACL